MMYNLCVHNMYYADQYNHYYLIMIVYIMLECGQNVGNSSMILGRVITYDNE